MGKRTSVYLTDAQTASLAALGTTMAEVVRAGLDALERPNAGWRAEPGPDGSRDAAAFVDEVIHEPGAPDLTAATLAGILVRTDPRMPDGFAAIVAPGNEPVVLRLPEKPALYPCCKHCRSHPAIARDSHKERCLQCPE